MRSTTAKRIMAKTTPATKAKVKTYAEAKIASEPIITQPGLFGYQRPRFKYPPITKQRIQEAKAQLEKKDYRGCAETLRDLRYKLEDFEKRIK